jgi:UDP-N-acetylglucosamine--N-acetylmuramyl-(pentapeptide) pyrophosphoryl-undecaprenol N-acetylglucosamine transferase
MALVNKNAAILVKDIEAKDKLGNVLLELTKDETKLNELSNNIKTLAKINAANEIVSEIIKQIK